MKKINRIMYLAVLVVTTWLGCKKPYLPPVIAATTNYLVVEGNINTGSDSTSIRLSRTVPLSLTKKSQSELGAKIVIVTNAGGNYPLSEIGRGFYTAPGLNLNSSTTYGLKITTSDGKVYQSDLVPAKYSPPIDSVYYKVQSDGLQIYADTHDPSSNSTYYRWDYQETYVFHSAFKSYLYLSRPETLSPRDTTNQIYTCWLTDSATNIILNSSAKLTKDIITNNLIAHIPSTSEKISDRYSILVKQYGLTVDAFNYYQQLKKNTEQLGSIFDAQPSELQGNIRCVTNPAEPVIGYITAGNVTQTRIFIDNRKLPAWRAITPYDGCVMDTLLFLKPVGANYIDEVRNYIWTGIQLPLVTIVSPGSTSIIGYTGSLPGCVDCTIRGSNKQPYFWTNQ